jgi:hypothetical protein
MKFFLFLVIGGWIGGWMLATLVLSFIAIIGKLGDTGSNYIGYWNIGIIGLGLIYGSPIGVVITLVMRIILNKIPFTDFIFICSKSGGIAFVLGCVGGWLGKGPLSAAPACIISFIISALIIGYIKYKL